MERQSSIAQSATSSIHTYTNGNVEPWDVVRGRPNNKEVDGVRRRNLTAIKKRSTTLPFCRRPSHRGWVPAGADVRGVGYFGAGGTGTGVR